MRIRPGYMLRKVMDIYAIIGVGSEAYVPNRIMSVNETGAFLWRILETGAERRELADALVKEYGVPLQDAERDVDTFLGQLQNKGLLGQ